MHRFFDKKNNRLVYINKKADGLYWDEQWSKLNIKSALKNSKLDTLVSPTTSRYIKPLKYHRILEGGCGMGQYVKSLQLKGYNPYGVDLAENTINQIKKIEPSLKVSVGDVRKLNFADNYFSGYWSLGVIEHFYNGFEDIVTEMKRVVKPGGYLFITFPHMSWIRRYKAKKNKYRIFEKDETKVKDFYQFALSEENVISFFKKNGFKFIREKKFDGLKGFKDEVDILPSFFWEILQTKNLFSLGVQFILSRLLAPLFSHSILLVFKNQK
jgi:SAM-dependent methyltransferase